MPSFWLDMISPRIPRTALVTGAARRLGRAIAQALADAGFAVALHYRESRKEAEELAREIAERGVQAAPLAADLANEAEVAALVARAEEALGPIGVLINNASRFEQDEWFNATRASWQAHMEPNLRAPFVLMQQFARALPNDAEGVIVNMLDQRVFSITPHFVSYTVSKAGLWALTQSMALALAPRIRVVGIGPGPTLPSPRQSASEFARQASLLPLKRGPTPEEIARAVLLVLTLPSFTGQMLALDGGQHLQWAAPTKDAMVKE